MSDMKKQYHHAFSELGETLAINGWGYPEDLNQPDFLLKNTSVLAKPDANPSQVQKLQFWATCALVKQLVAANGQLQRIGQLLDPEYQEQQRLRKEAEKQKLAQAALSRAHYENNHSRMRPFIKARFEEIDTSLKHLPVELRKLIKVAHLRAVNDMCRYLFPRTGRSLHTLFRHPVADLRNIKLHGIGPAKLNVWDAADAARKR